MGFYHKPVLLEEVMDGLNIKPSGIYVDCTLGGAGHAGEIARRLGSEGLLVGLEQDPTAFKVAKNRLGNFDVPQKIIRSNFRFLTNVMDRLSIPLAHGFLADLGVSSHQLDEPERGFSYMDDTPLDMRMDPDMELTAEKVVNTYSVERLAKIIASYGEERWSKRIADFIGKARDNQPITTTGGLVEIIKAAIPAGARRKGPHPAKRTFQALRIEVNDELGALEDLLERMVDRLAPGGRICIISFHSLEDRLVKKAFAEHAVKCICPRDFPKCVCGISPRLKIVTRKPIRASQEEIEANPRSRSAKLRIAEKLA
ncbi:MAG: 16S rRNA (cytosine(1402)-N(4))-methyltransferase RsmH [Clostridia bacterium]|nr:16S rRNA (cytosine(1402)-N(4))-methyltransferase RsmH [Clostridia bacterium]